MKKADHSHEREKIVAEAICPVASELRLLDAADLISLLRFERHGHLSELVASAAELYFLPGTVNFGTGGDYRLDWGSVPEITLDLEIRPMGVTIYAQLALKSEEAGIEINHIAFQEPSPDPQENTRFLARSLSEARYRTRKASPPGGAEAGSHGSQPSA